LSYLHNYFDYPTKLFSELYVAKFLDMSIKSFFPCIHHYTIAIKNDLRPLSSQKDKIGERDKRQ